jgi:hypothetical protein
LRPRDRKVKPKAQYMTSDRDYANDGGRLRPLLWPSIPRPW